jgi:hypothetical protein
MHAEMGTVQDQGGGSHQWNTTSETAFSKTSPITILSFHCRTKVYMKARGGRNNAVKSLPGGSRATETPAMDSDDVPIYKCTAGCCAYGRIQMNNHVHGNKALDYNRSSSL